MVDISVIVVNYNTLNHLRKCIESIDGKDTSVKYEIYVVDNNSKDGSTEYLKNSLAGDNYHIILNEENVGFAKANNQAMRLASGRYIMLLNPDTELMSGGLDEAFRFMEENKEVGVMGPSIYSSKGKELKVCRKYSKMIYDFCEWTPILNKFSLVSRNYREHEIDYTSASDVDCVQGACLVMRKEALDETGFLDERYFMYSEEEDLCKRMRGKGWKVVFNPRVKIKHAWGAATKQDKFNKYDLLFESKYLYYRKFYGRLYAQFFLKMMMTIMCIRKYYYSLMILLQDRVEHLKYQKDLSTFLLRKLSLIK